MWGLSVHGHVWPYTVQEPVAEELETHAIVDLLMNTNTIYNALEPWIHSSIYIRPYLNCLPPDNPRTLQYLQEKVLQPPSLLPYNFTTKE